MKKSIVWIWIVVLLIVVVGVVWYAMSQSGPATSNNTTSSSTANTSSTAMANTVNYYCASGTIQAAYTTGTVSLTLSDGRMMTLPQGMSGSGVRYEAGSGTSNDVVFSSEGNNAFLSENNNNTYDNCVAGTENPSLTGSSMTTYTDASHMFSFDYPNQFMVSGGEMGYSTNWRTGATTTGLELVVVTIPQSFQPKTNFGDSRFTVGTSADPDAVKTCLTDNNGGGGKSSMVTINGVQFSKLTYGDAGAGNLYDTTSYRMIHNSQCYAVEYTIHSLQLGNFPPSAGVTAFNSSTIQGIFEGMVQSFKFIQ